MKIIFPSKAQPEGCKYTFLYNTPSPAAAFKARLPVFIFCLLLTGDTAWFRHSPKEHFTLTGWDQTR